MATAFLVDKIIGDLIVTKLVRVNLTMEIATTVGIVVVSHCTYFGSKEYMEREIARNVSETIGERGAISLVRVKMESVTRVNLRIVCRCLKSNDYRDLRDGSLR